MENIRYKSNFFNENLTGNGPEIAFPVAKSER